MVGTDGILLGAWTPLYNPKKILEIGTGTGKKRIIFTLRL